MLVIMIIILGLFSCSSQGSMISTSIYKTQSVWTLKPSYTDLPTYTNIPNRVQEVTKVIFVTRTSTQTPIFSPTNMQTITNTPFTLQGSGRLLASPTQPQIFMSYFDLDLGRNIDDSSSDIEFDVGCGSQCFDSVNVIRGAIYFIYGRREPSYEDCKNNMVSQSDFITDKYICILTNSHNISIIKINWSNLTRDEYWKITFIYKTWKNRDA
jgi:hypothetical protein